MKIGVLGTGQVGQSLAKGFSKHGHEVKLGHRDPKASYADAAKFAEVVLLCTPWEGTENAIKARRPEESRRQSRDRRDNPIKPTPTNPFALALGFDDSGGEQVQRWLPQARVVKAFNIVGNSLMVDPKLPGGPPDMFIAGNAAAAKQTVTGICKDFGWLVFDIGGIEGSRLLEPLAALWCVVGSKLNWREQAWKLLAK